ncbi:MAG: hypothetical protein ACRDLM_10525 [Gaiellaceae bacterium]
MRGTTLRRGGATTLGDLDGLSLPAERTTVVRCALVLALAAALAGAILLASSAGSGRAAVLPAGVKSGVIVIDMSASVAGESRERIATVINGLAAANQAMGLVMFSDTAYDVLPANSPVSALLSFERFFNPQSIVHGAPIFGQTPWDNFSGGTRISSGLIEGEAALRRAHVTHGSLLLISDLDDAGSDEEPLVAAAFALRKARIPVRIVPLFAAPANVRIFTSLFGSQAFISPAAFKSSSGQHVQPIAASWPWGLIAVGAILVVLLAANEQFNTRLRPETAT